MKLVFPFFWGVCTDFVTFFSSFSLVTAFCMFWSEFFHLHFFGGQNWYSYPPILCHNTLQSQEIASTVSALACNVVVFFYVFFSVTQQHETLAVFTFPILKVQEMKPETLITQQAMTFRAAKRMNNKKWSQSIV